MEDWYPEAIINLGNNAGPYTDNGEPKGLLHTTEGKSYEGALGSYRTNNSWPHSTATYERGFFQIYQHNPLSLASRALKNLSGGVETNRDRVAQLEIVGTADINNKNSWGDQYVENFPKPYLDGIARWMRWVEKQLGVSRQSTVTWKSYPSSYGDNGVRLSGSQFDSYSGWLGHQHAPENSHGDPGLINISYLLDLPPTSPSGKDGEMIYELLKADGFKMVVLLSGGKQVRLDGQSTADNVKASPSYIGQINEASYDRLVKAYGQPIT